MAIETIGKYQLHLLAYEMPGSDQWDPFVTIERFDDARQDFVCVVERRHAADEPSASYKEAIEVARRFGTRLIETGAL
jgi:hypothetical protein